MFSRVDLSGVRPVDPRRLRARGGSTARRRRSRWRGALRPVELQRQPWRLGSIRLDQSIGIVKALVVEPQHWLLQPASNLQPASRLQPAQYRPKFSRAHDRTGGWAPHFDSTHLGIPQWAAHPEPTSSPLPPLATWALAPPSLLPPPPLVWWLLGRPVHRSGSHVDCDRQFVLINHIRGLWHLLRALQPLVPAGHVRRRRGPRAHRASGWLPG
jgi:hypothetical protein